MPYDLFWHGPFSAYSIYAKKSSIEAEQKEKHLLYAAWLYGTYTKRAIESCYKLYNPFAGKHDDDIPYPKEPLSLKPEKTPEEKEERKRLIEKMKKVNEKIGE